MPTHYENLDPFRRPGFPVEDTTDTTYGNRYEYRAPTATILTNKPTRGDIWADGVRVVAVTFAEIHGPSGYADLTVVTARSATSTFPEETPAEELDYEELQWRPVTMPLEVHPQFQEGGSFELNTTAYRCILGWKAEQDSELRAALGFRELNSDGTPGEEIPIPVLSPNAAYYIQHLMKGIEEFINYMPVFRKITIYRGTFAPTPGPCGMKDDPTGEIIPDGYEWIKAADDIQRVGTSSKWQRNEAWEGATPVWVDKDNLYL